MLDLCMYEFEDIIWDEFSRSDDHIVPHPSDEQFNGFSFQGDSHKKARLEVKCVSSNAGEQIAAKSICQGKEQREFSSLSSRSNTMLEKDSWTHTPNGVFPTSCDSDSNKEVTSLRSDNTRMSSDSFKSSNINSIGSEFCPDDPILSDKCAATDSNSYDYPLSHTSQTDNDLRFFDSNHEDKESSDLLYCGWPDIENFEDVDRMFRSCDSTFGLRSVGNDEELGWFSSSDAIERSEDVPKSDFKFSCSEFDASKKLSENHESSNLNNGSCSTNDSGMRRASVSYKESSQPSEDDESSTFSHLSFVKGPNNISESNDKFIRNEQAVEFNSGTQFKMSTINPSKNVNSEMSNLHKKQLKHHNQFEGKRKGQYLENGGSYHYVGGMRYEDGKLPSGDTTHQVLTSKSIRLQKQSLGPDSFGYLQNKIPYSHPDYSHPLDQTTSSPAPSDIKSESSGLTCLSPKESSFASNQVQPMEGTHDLSFKGIVIEHNENKATPHHQQGFQPSFTSNPEQVGIVAQTSICNPATAWKQFHCSGNEVNNHNDMEGVSAGIPAELDSANAQESPSMSSSLDDISLEATSFCQLQLVMEKLDLRTKLCIRDSLYRLARSAEQRHNQANLNSNGGNDRSTNGALITEGANKCTGFMDVETDTNPVDRSIAHLLFHRPSDSSAMPAYNALSSKSHGMIHGCVTSPAATTKKLVCKKETAAKQTERLLITDNK